MHEPGYVLNSVDHRNHFTALMAEHREVHGNPIFLEPRSLFRHLITDVVFLNVQSVWATTAQYTRQGRIQIADAVYFWLLGLSGKHVEDLSSPNLIPPCHGRMKITVTRVHDRKIGPEDEV